MEYMDNAMQNLMSSEMARNAEPTHDKAKAWIDKEVKFIDEIHPNGGNSKNVTSFWTNYRASLLANRAVFERHKPEIRYLLDECGGSFDTEQEAIDSCDRLEDDPLPVVTTFAVCEYCGGLNAEIMENADEWVYDPSVYFPCPTYTEIYNPIVSVM